ncbi:F-box only protein 28-like [Argiope bruennichi]|uniref:F-box only protein 28 like protein n=1 Tax=Argiope bruennichi TaxID=94029 RepID=A0A8T0FXW1_ARGBR|nr:F-box only protein 28-like [Argiope bruennichi]KAF8794469.1 F-box only protein 28 like protein [Argiope bruennichi]
MSLLHLPDDVLEKILSYISYDEVSRCRLVCRRINYVSKRVLNRGFHKVERYHAQCLRQVKSQLPRRESERRKHPLARHCDILTAVETRLSLLGMTFMKFIEMNLCCFIPGKVLDEIYKVLRYVTNEQSPVRAHEVLQELRDLSSMAMEHFDEKISPAFRKRKDPGPKIVTGISIFAPSLSHHSKLTSRHSSNDHKSSHKWKEEVKSMAQKQLASRKEIQFLKQRIGEMNKSHSELEKKVFELQNLLATHTEKLKEQDLKLGVVHHLVEIKTGVSPTMDVLPPTVTSDDTTTVTVTEVKANLQPSIKKRRQVRRINDRCRKRLKKN